MASEEISFENVHGRTTDDRRTTDAWLYYKLTYLASWKKKTKKLGAFKTLQKLSHKAGFIIKPKADYLSVWIRQIQCFSGMTQRFVDKCFYW